jgi:uncharacterized protein (TIGR00725 family)
MHKRPLIIGVMGGGRVSSRAVAEAYELGMLIARQGWILLNGGRNVGVMEASARGAAEHGGLTVGILPDADRSRMADSIHIPICTGLGSARNAINVLSSDVVVACAGGPGTISEIALALKHEKPVITLNMPTGPLFEEWRTNGRLQAVASPGQVIVLIREMEISVEGSISRPSSGPS